LGAEVAHHPQLAFRLAAFASAVVAVLLFAAHPPCPGAVGGIPVGILLSGPSGSVVDALGSARVSPQVPGPPPACGLVRGGLQLELRRRRPPSTCRTAPVSYTRVLVNEACGPRRGIVHRRPVVGHSTSSPLLRPASRAALQAMSRESPADSGGPSSAAAHLQSPSCIPMRRPLNSL